MEHLKTTIILISLALAGACDSGHDSRNSSGEQNDHDAHATGAEHKHDGHDSMPHDEPTEMSLYHLTSQWMTQDGEAVTLQDLKGKVQVLAMVYTTCQYACPRIVADLKDIQSKLQDKGLAEDAHFVLVSIDPKVDTVGRLKKFADDNDMNPAEWTLLTGKESGTLELAALLGVKYKKTSASDYAHSNIITIINPEGEVAYQQVGLGGDPTQTIDVILREVTKHSR
ncbi:MAG TPA: SCO family protein [Chryseolinea sp.]|nr:SCO family protein [Chryseolinea sp.]